MNQEQKYPETGTSSATGTDQSSPASPPLSDDRIITERQLGFCAVLRNILVQHELDPFPLRFENYYGTVVCSCYRIFFSMFIPEMYTANAEISAGIAEMCGLPYEDISLEEKDKDDRRVFFSRPEDLYRLSDHIADLYSSDLQDIMELSFAPDKEQYIKNMEDNACRGFRMEDEEMLRILERTISSDYSDIRRDDREPIHDRNSVEIHPSIALRPTSPKPMTPPRKFRLESALSRSERDRKEGRITDAVNVLMKARRHGYLTPKLYDSLADLFDAQREYDNAILILDEGIQICTYGIKTLILRRDRVIGSLLSDRELNRKLASLPKERK